MFQIAILCAFLIGIYPFAAIATAPTLSSERVHLRTQADGDVDVLVSLTVVARPVLCLNSAPCEMMDYKID